VKLLQGRKKTYSKTLNLFNNEQGMTLLEELVALLILSIVLVTIMDRFAQASRQNSDATRYNEALSLAQSKIEEIKEKNYSSVNSVALKSFSSESDYSQFQGMNYAVAVVDSGLNKKTVTVAVYYTDQEIPKQLELTTEVARR
jgi:Tfp pilus assembly protein PilV